MLNWPFTLFILGVMFFEESREWFWNIFLGDPEYGNDEAFDIPANKVPWWFI